MTMGLDQMGTMFARREGIEPDLDPVYIGSHLDTQPTGGKFDGNLARGPRIAPPAHDMVWYVDYRRGLLGRLNPETRKVDEWPMPSGADARPYAMTKDDQGRLWFVETGVQPNRLVGFDPTTSQFFSSTPIPSSGAERNTVRHMVFDAKTGMIWFGTDAGTIGRATVSRPSVM